MKNNDSNNSYKPIMPEQDRLIYDKQNRRQTSQPLSTPTQSSGTYHPNTVNTPMQNNGLYRPNTANTAQNDLTSYLSTTPHSQLNYSNVSRGSLDTNKPISYNTYTGKNTGSNYTTIAKADAAPKTYLDTLGYTMDDLRTTPNKLQTYISGLGGINTNDNTNTYQIIYGTWDKPPIDEKTNTPKPTGPANRYSNYEFDTLDALNWLIQTGGNTNFVLQMRDVHNMTDSANKFDDWAVKDISANWQASVIEKFLEAAEILNGFRYNVNMPKFFLGAAEHHPETLINSETKDGIYKQVRSKLGANKNVVAGAYYGENFDPIVNIDGTINTEDKEYKKAIEVSDAIHKKYGGQMLFIPFYNLGEGINGYFDRAKRAASITYNDVWEDHPIFDTIIFQPGTYFYEKDKGMSTDDIYTLSNMINEWNIKHPSTLMGMELEYDMSAITGRDDDNYSVRNTEKKERIREYIKAIENLHPGTPIGIYSGGPNEQGYANPLLNSNIHNTGNHIVQDSWQSYYIDNGIPYNEFAGAYDGNFVYDMNDYVYRNMRNGIEMSDKLYNFLAPQIQA